MRGTGKMMFEKILAKRLQKNTSKTTIELCLGSEAELYNRFSVINGSGVGGGKHPKISNEIIDYLTAEAGNAPPKNSLRITIKMPGCPNGRAEAITQLLKDNFKGQIEKVNKKISKTNRHAFIFAIVGIILIGLTQIFQVLERRFSLNEFVIVMSWVFMWKAVELMFFERAKLMREKALLIKIYYSEITLLCTMT